VDELTDWLAVDTAALVAGIASDDPAARLAVNEVDTAVSIVGIASDELAARLAVNEVDTTVPIAGIASDEPAARLAVNEVKSATPILGWLAWMVSHWKSERQVEILVSSPRLETSVSSWSSSGKVVSTLTKTTEP
jgi:hypothetical protein